MLRPFAYPVACCCVLLKPVKLFSQQLTTFLLFRDRRSVAQQCWIRLHNSSNIVGATHAHYAWFTKTCGLYPSHDALQVPTLLGVVASVCTLLPKHTQQLPTLLAQQCWELLRPFARSLRLILVIEVTTVTVQIDVRMHERISFKIFGQETQGPLFASLRAAARLRKFSPDPQKLACSQANCSRKNICFLVYNECFKPALTGT